MENKKGLIIRLRTITLTILVVGVLALYLLVKAYFKDEISWIDFIVLTLITIIMHCAYYPDGELNGQRDERYTTNHKAYNDKAELINKKRQIFHLTEYCKVDFKNRKRDYVETKCGYLEITPEILNRIRNRYSYKEIKKADYIFINEEETERYFLSHYKRKTLKGLLFEELPVGYNSPETILSAKETSSSKAIQDDSKRFKYISYASRIMTALIIGLIFAYVGFSAKDGFGLADACKLMIYLTSMVATAVFSYSSGEKAMKILKADFYIALCNFIEKFFVWLLEDKHINIDTYTYTPPVETEKPKLIEHNIEQIENIEKESAE